MSNDAIQEKQRDQAYEFVANVFGLTADESRAATPAPPGREFSAATPRKNQPEFWADAPWRIEPDRDHVPMVFIIRDGDIQKPGKGPYRLKELRVEQRLADGSWHEVRTFEPADLPGIDAEGHVDRNFWSFRTTIPLRSPDPGSAPGLKGALRGGPPLHLRVVFDGHFPAPHEEDKAPDVHLEVSLAKHGLPQGRAVLPSAPRRWFYGDTHYHSDHTNDVKEFGGPVQDSRDAGLAIGLDWLVITDHSCDLDEPAGSIAAPGEDPDPAASRWERLKAQVASPQISNEEFRCLLGEEITLRGGDGERYVHMLAFGGMEEMIPGGFLPEDEGGFMTQLFQGALDDLIEMAIREGGYHPDTGRRLFGPVHTLAEVLEALPAETLVFAAHPYDIAQPPFVNCDWDQDDLDNPRLTGHEPWNGRSRRSALLTDDPFSTRRWNSRRRLTKSDRDRLKKLRGYADSDWDRALRQGIEAWAPDEPLPARRPVFIAGSDAHGSYNYSVGWGWDYQTQLMCSDNALGRARTAVFLPEHDSGSVPETEQILAALKKGSCAVTDGPLLEVSLSQGGRTAYMGDALPVEGEGDVEMRIVAHTTPEFGDVEWVEVIADFADPPEEVPAGQEGRGLGQQGGDFWRRVWHGQGPRRTTVRAGQRATIRLAGAQGYCRVQATTTGPDGERFCCFSNPIWLRAVGGAGRQPARRMRITLAR
jgi:hypothetical protein